LGRAGVLGFVAATLLLAGCGSEGIPDESGVSQGKELFSGEGQCAGCHTLADAGSRSDIGPNLDDAFRHVREEGFDESSIRSLVRNQIAYPVEDPVTGESGMPPDLVEGEDADAVAAYVASVAGTRPEEAAGGGPQGTDGESIFGSAGCGSCHTLDAAGGSGTIGPNLDQSKPPLQRAVRQITNGGGGMPPFKGQLTNKQIRELAAYVVRVAGKS
jgi:mono/diheme cytochrome c family protein